MANNIYVGQNAQQSRPGVAAPNPYVADQQAFHAQVGNVARGIGSGISKFAHYFGPAQDDATLTPAPALAPLKTAPKVTPGVLDTASRGPAPQGGPPPAPSAAMIPAPESMPAPMPMPTNVISRQSYLTSHAPAPAVGVQGAAPQAQPGVQNWHTGQPAQWPIQPMAAGTEPFEVAELRALRGLDGASREAGINQVNNPQQIKMYQDATSQLYREYHGGWNRGEVMAMQRSGALPGGGGIPVYRGEQPLQIVGGNPAAAFQEAQREASPNGAGGVNALNMGQAGAQAKIAAETQQGAYFGAHAEQARAEAAAKTADAGKAERMLSDPEAMFHYTLKNTSGDVQAAEAARQRVIEANRQKAADAANPAANTGAVDANNALSVLNGRYQSIAHLFDTAGGQPAMDLPAIYQNVSTIAPQGWNDPGSELGQAMAARIRSLYGSNLQNQLHVPRNPQELLGTLPKALSWLRYPTVGIMEGHPFESAQGRYAEHADATNWFNAISGQPSNY